MLLITTAVDAVQIGYGTPDAKNVPSMTVEEAKGYLEAGEFAPGSMAPKIKACIEFVEETGGEALITSPERLSDALAKKTGTYIVP